MRLEVEQLHDRFRCRDPRSASPIMIRFHDCVIRRPEGPLFARGRPRISRIPSYGVWRGSRSLLRKICSMDSRVSRTAAWDCASESAAAFSASRLNSVSRASR